MIALLLLLAMGLWVGLGFLIWKFVLRRVLVKPLSLLVGTVFFAAVWLLGPWADEYLGQKEFARLCAAMPDTQFLGPVSVGEGPFFDAQGQPKWTNRKEFEAIAHGGVASARVGLLGMPNVTQWDQLFTRTEENYRIANWPVPVLEQRLTYRYKTTGQTVLVSHWRGSPGGWLNRASSWGSHAPYQCGKKTPYPHEIEWIKF